MNNTILVTGGLGFIGSHMVDKLIRMGNKVIIVDNKSAQSNDNFYYLNLTKNNEVFEYDIADYNKLDNIFKYHNIDYIYHFAAEARIQPAILNPELTINTNINGTLNILELAKKYKIKRVVYSSSSSVYGNTNPPHIENGNTDCLNIYSISKKTGEDLCKMYNDIYGVDTIILRYFNVFGPRQPLKGKYAPVVGLFLKQLENDEPLTIVGDGTQRRSFTYIHDVIRANILAMFTKLDISEDNNIFNISGTENYSILELAKMISNNFIYVPKRTGEPLEIRADITKAKNILKWEPKYEISEYISDRLKKIKKYGRLIEHEN